MKKNLSFAIIAMSILGLGSLTSCHDEDFDVSTAVLQERAFEQGFIKEFGKPSADQTWDFYAARMEAIRKEAGKTRATMAYTVTATDITQPYFDDAAFKEIADSWKNSLEEGHPNSDVGQNSYTLTSTGNFKIYAVNYGGGFEVDDYGFELGLIYIDEDGSPKPVPLFGPGFNDDDGFEPTYPSHAGGRNEFGNPGWGKLVEMPAGVRFYFYMKFNYTFKNWGEYNWRTGWEHPSTTQSQLYYSNETPAFHDYFGDEVPFDQYGGNSTLLYTTERITEGHDEQIMMIGFEDAFGIDGSKGTDDWDDMDFNDVVLVIEGELPVSENKRFFAEDKKSLDWDYNDVVFDVSNTGIVLRAVGGTLPVWLKVTDKKGKVTYTEELHELMKSLQFEDHNKIKELTFQRDGETFYKPIDVAAYEINPDYPGIWFDPVQIIKWTIDDGTRLEYENGRDEVALFAHPFSSDKVGDVELIVGSKYEDTLEDALARIAEEEEETPGSNKWLDSDANDKRPKISRFPANGDIPAMWTGTTNVRWMKELQKITLGYENFYGGGEVVNGVPQWWRSSLHDSFWYQFLGDEPD